MPNDADDLAAEQPASAGTGELQNRPDAEKISAATPISLSYAAAPERIMIEQIVVEPTGSWDFAVGALVAFGIGLTVCALPRAWWIANALLLMGPPLLLLRRPTTRKIGTGWLAGAVLVALIWAAIAWMTGGWQDLPVSLSIPRVASAEADPTFSL